MFKNEKTIEKTVTITLKVFDREDSDDLIKQDIESELDCCWHSLEIENIEIYKPSFPVVVGERAEMLVDGVWRKGKLEFAEKFGMSPEKCKELMERVAEIVNGEVQEVIEHADYYMNPTDYCSEEMLKEEFGEDALEKDEDADGYPNLYDYRKSHSAVMLFMDLISWHTKYGGHTSAIEACGLMDIGEGWRE